MKQILISLAATVALTVSALAAEVYGPSNPTLLSSYVATGTNSITPSTSPAATFPAAQLAEGVTYATLGVAQSTTNSATSNVVYVLSGLIKGTTWHPIVSLTVALQGTNTATGFTNIPASVLGGFRYVGITSVSSDAYPTNYTTTVKMGFWHLQ